MVVEFRTLNPNIEVQVGGEGFEFRASAPARHTGIRLSATVERSCERQALALSILLCQSRKSGGVLSCLESLSLGYLYLFLACSLQAAQVNNQNVVSAPIAPKFPSTSHPHFPTLQQQP